MGTHNQAYMNGFFKRASEYGLNPGRAEELLKAGNFFRSIPSALKSGFNAFKNTMQAARKATPASSAAFNPMQHLSPGELQAYRNFHAPSAAPKAQFNPSTHLSPGERAAYQAYKQQTGPFNPATHLSPGERAAYRSYKQQTGSFNPNVHLSPGEMEAYRLHRTSGTPTSSPVSSPATNQRMLPIEAMRRKLQAGSPISTMPTTQQAGRPLLPIELMRQQQQANPQYLSQGI